MYIEMLNSAIAQRKGTGEAQEEKKTIKKANAKVDAYIPSAFAPQDYEKIKLYQRIDDISTKHELMSFAEEIKDNYGHLPSGVQMLLEKKRLDILINEPHIEEYKETTYIDDVCYIGRYFEPVKEDTNLYYDTIFWHTMKIMESRLWKSFFPGRHW